VVRPDYAILRVHTIADPAKDMIVEIYAIDISPWNVRSTRRLRMYAITAAIRSFVTRLSISTALSMQKQP
jgi:hypothetical protein